MEREAKQIVRNGRTRKRFIGRLLTPALSNTPNPWLGVFPNIRHRKREYVSAGTYLGVLFEGCWSFWPCCLSSSPLNTPASLPKKPFFFSCLGGAVGAAACTVAPF